ncbi:thermonuclease family protein [Pseudoroseicyclus aestuarii]|uniref:Endonuclease YncB(Thermonuclease family) n=1 Tax=Pseudoroseicyclus aestuarii TaxID=1795041 RepID=A0A318T094_9RHOB|nr:thermonuclease family protein [Pseudoroseicyclus aestuarii]PYE85477.1 endonuclease YncB(thermonuclease family) [Pseudoroseicyclus aestuarii]
MPRLRFLALIALLLCCAGLAAAMLSGAPGPGGAARVERVVDADTFVLDGERIRLFGVDAPESAQHCPDGEGGAWECGAWATEVVRDRLEGQRLTCREVERDRYGRSVARCSLDGADLGSMLTAEGLATAYRAYSTDYVEEEATARAAGLGIWRGGLTAPSDWRAGRREVVPVPQASRDCRIKGNISSSGRIYHLPGSRHYEDTRIDTAAGERWFCTEEEALAAGWRAPRG